MLDVGLRTGVTITTQYLNAYEDKGKEYLYKVCVVSGKRKAEFIKGLTEEKRAEIIKIENDQIFYRIRVDTAFHHLILGGTVFFLRPVLAYGGWEYWTLGSLQKRHLLEIFKKVKSIGLKTEIYLQSLRQMPINILLPSVFTSLTKKQLEAIRAASKFGYYEYPRKSSAEDISKRLHVPRSTFQEHLKKAESKLMASLLSETAIFSGI